MTDLDFLLDLGAAICLILSALLSLGAAMGLLRFPDALSRLHAGTKPQILGLIFVLLAIAMATRSWPTLIALIPVIVFQVLTTPAAAHMIGRAGYRVGNLRRALLVVDELADDIERADERRSAGPTKPEP